MTPIDAFGLLCGAVGGIAAVVGYIRLIRPHTPFAKQHERRTRVRDAAEPLWWACPKCGRSPGPHVHPDRGAEVWR